MKNKWMKTLLLFISAIIFNPFKNNLIFYLSAMPNLYVKISVQLFYHLIEFLKQIL